MLFLIYILLFTGQKKKKSGKAKGNTTVTKSERELRRLKSTINYNGKQTTNGGGRDKGNPQIKL